MIGVPIDGDGSSSWLNDSLEEMQLGVKEMVLYNIFNILVFNNHFLFIIFKGRRIS